MNPWTSGHELSVGVEFISQVNSENQFSIIEVKNCIQSIILFSKSSNYKLIIEIGGASLSNLNVTFYERRTFCIDWS